MNADMSSAPLAGTTGEGHSSVSPVSRRPGSGYVRPAGRPSPAEEYPEVDQDRDYAALQDIRSPIFASWEVGREWLPEESDDE